MTPDDAPDLMTFEGRARALEILDQLRTDERRKTAALCLALRTLTHECDRHDVSVEMNMMLAGFRDEQVDDEIKRMKEHRPIIVKASADAGPFRRAVARLRRHPLLKRDC